VVSGKSMQPTINERGDILLVNKLFCATGLECTGGWNAMHRRNFEEVKSKSPITASSASPSPLSTLSPLTYNDTVLCVSKYNPNRYVIKRVIGLPGDYVLVHEKFWATRSFRDPPPPAPNHQLVYRLNEQNVNCPRRRVTEVGDGMVWLEGDSEENSKDSRDYGEVPAGLVLGRVAGRIWPLSQVTSKLKNPFVTNNEEGGNEVEDDESWRSIVIRAKDIGKNRNSR